MGSITIQDIDDQLKARLRVRAMRHGRSMEDEARDILHTALLTEPVRAHSLVDTIRARIEPLDGIELDIPPSDALRKPVDFD